MRERRYLASGRVTKDTLMAATKVTSRNFQLKLQLRQFLGIPDPSSRADLPLLISKFLRLHKHQSPGIKKDRIWEDNLKAILHGKDRVGLPEINKILAPEFNDPSLKFMEMEKQKWISSKKQQNKDKKNNQKNSEQK